jgi:hypothetical protein
MHTRRTVALIVLISILMLTALAACGAPEPTATPVPTATPEPPGSVSGLLVYQNLQDPGIVEPLPGALIVLCQIAEGLPEGPVASSANRDGVDPICTLMGQPTALSDESGAFTLDGVPPGSYLVLFHPSPAELEEAEVDWKNIALTEAVFDEVKQEVAASGKADLWQKGGQALAIGNWSADQGMVLTKGNICSDGFGFCFSLLEEAPTPVVEVDSGKTATAELKAHFRPDN